MNHKLDEHEDAGAKSSGDSRSHAETSENSTKSLALVPAPLYLISTNSSNTNTSDGRNERIGRRDVSGVFCAPHDPHGGTGESTGESQHLNAGVSLESRVWNDSVLDGIGRSRSDSDGSQHLKDGTEYHGLSVGDGPRRNTGGPGVGHIVYEPVSIRT